MQDLDALRNHRAILVDRPLCNVSLQCVRYELPAYSPLCNLTAPGYSVDPISEIGVDPRFSHSEVRCVSLQLIVAVVEMILVAYSRPMVLVLSNC